MTEEEVFRFYQDRFKPIYADLVAVTGQKSLEVDGQIESAMSHLAVGKTANNRVVLQTNVDAAFVHLGRACLDAAKLLWLDRFGRVDQIVRDPLVRKWCSHIANGELLRLHREGEELTKAARRRDAAAAGHSIETLLDQYCEAIAKFQEILDSMDLERLEEIRNFRIAYLIRQQLVGFLVGVVASLIASLIYSKYF